MWNVFLCLENTLDLAICDHRQVCFTWRWICKHKSIGHNGGHKWLHRAPRNINIIRKIYKIRKLLSKSPSLLRPGDTTPKSTKRSLSPTKGLKTPTVPLTPNRLSPQNPSAPCFLASRVETGSWSSIQCGPQLFFLEFRLWLMFLCFHSELFCFACFSLLYGTFLIFFVLLF